MDTTTIHGQPSWRLASDAVEAFVTEKGGHLAPVTFRLGSRTVQPFMIAPWAEETLAPDTDEVLRLLRGDFFCMPFGDSFMAPDGRQYPLHGEPATGRWELVGNNGLELTARLTMTVRPGQVTKTIRLAPGHQAVYCRHEVAGVAGAMSYGVHPTLQLPAEGLVSISPFDLGEVCPFPFELPEKFGYQSLRPGATFSDLRQVPLLNGGSADLTRYPARRGFEDFVMARTRPDLSIGWAAVVVPSHGYMWFSLKDPKVLPVSLMWMSNGGRHYPPWNSRNLNVLGMEEAALRLPLGPAESAAEFLADCPVLSPDTPLVVNTIMGVAAIPAGFGRVAEVRRIPGGIELVPDEGAPLAVTVNVDFLWN